MSSCEIEELFSMLYKYNSLGSVGAVDARNINAVLDNIATGVSIPMFYRGRLYDILKQLQLMHSGVFRDAVYRVLEKIKRERYSDAAAFYVSHGMNAGEIAINFEQEVYTSHINEGDVLYQWCKFIMINGGTECSLIYNSYHKKEKTTVGRYFSKERVPIECLGAAGLFDLKNREGHVYGTASQVRFRFTFPFSIPCLVSIASPAIDAWNCKCYHDGTPINRQNFPGIQTSGGARQYFIPLNEEQMLQLANIAIQD